MREKDLWTAFNFAWEEPVGDIMIGLTQAFEALFKAPASGQYRFIMSCDDDCTFKMNHAGDDPLDPDYAQMLLMRDTWTTYRDTEVLDKTEDSDLFGVVFSKWVTLVQDEYYYMESTLSDGGGRINLDVGMEVIPDVMPANHPYAEKQVQKMSIAQQNILYDTMEVKVTNPDQGLFIMAMLKPGTSEWVKSGQITAGGDAD